MSLIVDLNLIVLIVTMGFIGMQWYVAKKQRQDGLFKLRYRLYQEIVRIFQKASENTDEIFVDKMKADYYIDKYNNLLFESGCIFGDEIEKSLRSSLKCDNNGYNIFTVLNEEGKRTTELGWIPNDEFNKQFKPYLKLESNYFRELFSALVNFKA
jgi:hypothetical protein